MYVGGVVINQRTEWTIRLAGLIIPFLLVGYTLMVKFGLMDTSHYAGDLPLYVMMPIWVGFGIYQFSNVISGKIDAIIRMTVYHVFGSIYILFVAGFSMSFIAGWVILFLANYAFFADRGYRISMALLFVVAALDTLLHIGDRAIFYQDVVAVASILVVGMTAVAIGRIQEVDGAELTRSKRSENLQRDRIMTIVNNLADAVLSTDRNGIIRVYNAASLNLLDTNNSLNGQHINDIVSLYDQDDKPVNLFTQFKQATSVVIRDDLTMTVGGETMRLEITYSPIRSSYSQSKQTQTEDGYIIILRDVTKAKSLEEERDEFISVVSHELRTPITIAEGTISNVQLMMERPDIAKATLKEGVATAHDQIIFLSRMVNDLSTLSRAERGVADTTESINVRDLINDLYNEYAPQASKKGLHFNLDLSTHLGSVNASRLYLKELLQNFVTNSLKYTKQGSITLAATRQSSMIRLEVRDTGIGISKTDQAKIFNKFYRSEDYRTRETGGTGLGLYVAVKLARKLGTRISLESRLNHGSTFSIELPFEPTE